MRKVRDVVDLRRAIPRLTSPPAESLTPLRPANAQRTQLTLSGLPLVTPSQILAPPRSIALGWVARPEKALKISTAVDLRRALPRLTSRPAESLTLLRPANAPWTPLTPSGLPPVTPSQIPTPSRSMGLD